MATTDVIEQAHQSATGRAPDELARELQEMLGQKLVAFALGDRHPKTVGRYARGDREPEPDAMRRLVDLYTVVEILQHGMQERTVKTWMLGTNPVLRGNAPIDVFHEGRAYEVMGAAKAFVTAR
jgi:hypothetical protein